MRTVVAFVVAILLCNHESCFAFSFFGSSSSKAKEPEQPAISIASATKALSSSSSDKKRGVPSWSSGAASDYDFSSKKDFVCDKSKVISAENVNDGFCDCADGTDEPGTSACSNGNFHCQNIGYRPLKISSSRVDDGLCDCCDGSDEGLVVNCENKCAAMYAKEREMITKLSNAYTVGSQVRLENEREVRSALETKSASLESLSSQVLDSTNIVDGLRAARDTIKEQIQALTDEHKTSALAESRNLIKIDEIPDMELILFMIYLFRSTQINLPNDVTRIFDQIANSKGESSVESDESQEAASDPDDYPRNNGGDDVGDNDDDEDSHRARMDDEYDPEESHHPGLATEVDVSPDGTTDSDAVATEPTIPESKCPIYLMAGKDERFMPFCRNGDDNSISTAKMFIMEGLFKQKQPFREAQKLLSFYNNKKSYVGVDVYLETLDEGTVDFSTSDRLSHLYRIFHESYEKIYPDDAISKGYTQADQAFRDAQLALSTLETEKNEADGAAKDLENYRGNLAFLAYKNKCFSTTGGHYTYTACFFKSVSQKENDGHNSVSLGEFASFDEQEDGSFKMFFNEGQHCWNHGARTAEVHIKCGSENKVLGAREPSTCAYALEMESPLACTEKFKNHNGIV